MDMLITGAQASTRKHKQAQASKRTPLRVRSGQGTGEGGVESNERSAERNTLAAGAEGARGWNQQRADTRAECNVQHMVSHCATSVQCAARPDTHTHTHTHNHGDKQQREATARSNSECQATAMRPRTAGGEVLQRGGQRRQGVVGERGLAQGGADGGAGGEHLAAAQAREKVRDAALLQVVLGVAHVGHVRAPAAVLATHAVH